MENLSLSNEIHHIELWLAIAKQRRSYTIVRRFGLFRRSGT